MNNGSGDSTGCFEIKLRTDTAKITNMRIARFRQRRDLIRKTEVFIEKSNICEQSE